MDKFPILLSWLTKFMIEIKKLRSEVCDFLHPCTLYSFPWLTEFIIEIKEATVGSLRLPPFMYKFPILLSWLTKFMVEIKEATVGSLRLPPFMDKFLILLSWLTKFMVEIEEITVGSLRLPPIHGYTLYSIMISRVHNWNRRIYSRKSATSSIHANLPIFR